MYDINMFTIYVHAQNTCLLAQLKRIHMRLLIKAFALSVWQCYMAAD